MAHAPAQAAGIPGQGTWETTLLARDINGDGTTDAYFDTALNLTWLADAWPLGGNTVSWAVASDWAATLNVYGVSGWRLPATVDAPSSAGFPPPAGSSELAHMYLVTLGNGSLGLTNTGPFSNLQSYVYWSGTEHEPGRQQVWTFSTSLGLQTLSPKNVGLYAWAVHSGDVSAVPEPTTTALVLVGLIPLLAAKRRR